MTARPGVTFVIMAGGRGERLWPLVTVSRPKVCAAPQGGRTLLASTLARLARVDRAAEQIIVTAEEQVGPIRTAVPRGSRVMILAEPEGKNTAACIALVAGLVAACDPSRVLVFGPADHWIDDEAAFARAIRTAVAAASRRETLVTIGIRPTHAHTGLGYLCAGPRAGRGTYALRRFLEKPPAAALARLMAQPGVYWNGGYFIGRASAFLQAIRTHLPQHARRLGLLGRETLRKQRRGAYTVPSLRRAYRALPPVSFDHGVMEHLRGGLIVEGRFSWADLGSWDVWSRLGARHQRTLMLESDNVAVVGSSEHLVAAVGVRDLVIVHTAAATLVCHRDKAQSVRDLVKRLGATPALAAYR